MLIDSDSPIPNLPGMAGRNISRASADRFCSPKLLRLFTWWQEIAADHPPRYVDFDILQHPILAPNLFVIAPQDYGYLLRLAGEDYADMFGLKKGFQWRRDTQDLVDRDFTGYLDFATRQAVPYYSRGRLLLHERDWLQFESLLCPVLDTDGSTMLLGAAARMEPF